MQYTEDLIPTKLLITESDLSNEMAKGNNLDKLNLIGYAFSKRRIYIDSYENTRNVLKEFSQGELVKVERFTVLVNYIWKRINR